MQSKKALLYGTKTTYFGYAACTCDGTRQVHCTYPLWHGYYALYAQFTTKGTRINGDGGLAARSEEHIAGNAEMQRLAGPYRDQLVKANTASDCNQGAKSHVRSDVHGRMAMLDAARKSFVRYKGVAPRQ